MRDKNARVHVFLGFLGIGVLLLAGYEGIEAHVTLAPPAAIAQSDPPNWQHVSTTGGHLALPSTSTQQVLALITDINNDGRNDFIVGARRGGGPALVWYRRDATGWTRHVIETDSMQLEAGGAVHDIDGDGDQDLVAGSNAQTNEIWWWENPYPDLNPGADWTRRIIKNSGASKHHDMMFGNFDDDAVTEFVYWNQNANTLFIVEIPPSPATTQPWAAGDVVFTAPDNKREGLAQADVDGDGKTDIVGGGYWFKHVEGANYTANVIETGTFMRVAAGQLIPGGRPEIVQVPGDASGIGRWFVWDGVDWIGRDLPIGEVKHGHSLELADVNGDGNLDIFIGEMRYANSNQNSNPNARTILLYGDGQGNFAVETVATGYGQHESRLGDLDGDGDIDILGKPFTWDTPRIDIWLNSPAAAGCVSPLENWDTHIIDTARPYRAVFVTTADVDGDDLADIVTGAWWYRNPGTPGGVWQRNEIGTPLNQMAAVVDFDGDGDPDILGTVLKEGASETQYHLGSAFVWARNDGEGTFEIFDNVDSGTGDFLQGVAVGTFSSAENMKVILSWHARSTHLQSLTVPDEPATEQWIVDMVDDRSQFEELSAGDIDRDDDTDLLLGTIWLENQGGSFIDHQLFATSDQPDRNRLADINGDARLDAVVGYESNSGLIRLAWYEAPPDPTQPWEEHIIDTIIAPMSLDVGDMDGDGDIDIVAGEHNKANPSQGRIFVYENDEGNFVPRLIGYGDEHHDGAQLVDIDDDGDLDVVSIGWTHGRVLVYEQIGCPDAEPTPDPEDTPTVTPTPKNSPTPTSTPNNTPTATSTPAGSPTPTSTPGTDGSESTIYVSSTSGGNVGGISFADEDILRLDTATGTWSMFFDGSDVGLNGDVDAMHLRTDGTLLLSLDTEQRVGSLGKVDDSDILLFTPISFGSATSGTLSLYFDGSDVGLTTNAEDINALSESPEGHLVIGTNGNAGVPGVSAKKWDLLLFVPNANGLGSNTAGTWSLYLRGSEIGLSTSSEPITAASLAENNRLLLNTKGTFKVGAISGGAADVFECRPATGGATSNCSPPPAIFWRGGTYGFGSESIDALMVGPDPGS